jgi:hypothetical protein
MVAKRRIADERINVELSSEKNFTVSYKESAPRHGNFGRIDSSFAAQRVRGDKV